MAVFVLTDFNSWLSRLCLCDFVLHGAHKLLCTGKVTITLGLASIVVIVADTRVIVTVFSVFVGWSAWEIVIHFVSWTSMAGCQNSRNDVLTLYSSCACVSCNRLQNQQFRSSWCVETHMSVGKESTPYPHP